MVRPPCCDQKEHIRKGAWTGEEDERLINYIKLHGEGAWKSLPRAAGLLRCGKSCRLRWINYLRPDLKRGNFTREEDELIINLQRVIGNKWSLIAARLPGRTDNEIKNHWNTHIKRKLLDRANHPQLQRQIYIIPTLVSNRFGTRSLTTTSSSGNNTIYSTVKNTGTWDKTKSDIRRSYCSSSSNNNTVVSLSPDQEINLELSMSLPQSHEAMKINDKFKLEKKWEFRYPQLFGKSTLSIPSNTCLCYSLGGYQNGNVSSSCNKCATMMMMSTNVDAANRFSNDVS